MSKKFYIFSKMGENLSSIKMFDDTNPVDEESDKREFLISAIREVAENELTNRQKEVFSMFYFENMSVKEITEILQKNKTTVYRMLHTAERRISKYLKYLFAFLYHFQS